MSPSREAELLAGMRMGRRARILLSACLLLAAFFAGTFLRAQDPAAPTEAGAEARSNTPAPEPPSDPSGPSIRPASPEAARGARASADPDREGRATKPVLILFAVLLVFSAVASAAETAIFSLNKIDVLQAKRTPTRGGRALVYLLDHPNDTLTTIIVINNIVNVGLSLAAGALTETYFSGLTVKGLAWAAFGATSFILVFGEVIPKCVAHLKANHLAPIFAWPIAILGYLLTPFRVVTNRIIDAAFDRLKVPDQKMTDRVSEEELKAMITAGEVKTILEEDEREMIHGVFELSHTFAEEIMIPRSQVAALEDTLGQEALHAALRESKFKRVLIYHENLDHVVGFVLVKEALLNPERPWREFVRPLLCVPLRIRLYDLLVRFRRESMKLAGVIDEYGGVAGIVTLHDLLEEIVGDIAEHHDPPSLEIRQLEPGRWQVAGQMNLQELGKELGAEFPADLGTTVGGFVMNSLGSVPTPGAELDFDGFKIKVGRMMGRRVVQVEVRRVSAPEPEGAAGEPEKEAAR